MTPCNDKPGNSTEEIDAKYRSAQTLIDLGVPVAKACRRVGLNRKTYYNHLNKRNGAGLLDKAPAHTTQPTEYPGKNRAFQPDSSTEPPVKPDASARLEG